MKSKEDLLKLIIKRRQTENKTVYAACQGAGISTTTWYLVEDGERAPTYDLLFRMARALGMRVSIDVK